jgi:thiol peroxidase
MSVGLADLTGKVKIFSVVPSIDTPVCDAQTKKFNVAATTTKGVEIYTISMDMPFAAKRWCGAFGVDRVTMLSDHQSASFGQAYGTLIKELRLESRAVFVLDETNRLRHVEYVKEIADHPDYDTALSVARLLLPATLPPRGKPTSPELLRPLAKRQPDAEAPSRNSAPRRHAAPATVGAKVFLCHASSDKAKVRELYHQLREDGFVPWLDEEDLLPGQDWDHEIRRVISNADAVVACLSKGSISKLGYVQKEIVHALDLADLRPEGTIFLVPARLEECEVPQRLARYHYVDLFLEGGYERLTRSLRVCKSK